ncbi:MAG: hypothetical protein EPN74_01610 [Rhodanobacter sp.]|nr:MAG: hypothetical protein EPN74_01610 [Rhodanobacter sp.]
MVRSRQLSHQFRDIERCIRKLPKRSRTRLSTLTLREIGQASRSDFPHLYGTPPDVRYVAWGRGTDVGYERARSDNSEVALRGIALWLAVAYHETKNSPYTRLQPQYRKLQQLLRELKEIHQCDTADDTVEDWMQTSAVA